MFKLARRFIARLYANVKAITQAVMEGVVLVVVLAMIAKYVVGNETILNTTDSTMVAAIVPILQAAMLIAGILGAIAIIYFAATNSFKSK